jgi:ribose transport system substrate-binding protein
LKLAFVSNNAGEFLDVRPRALVAMRRRQGTRRCGCGFPHHVDRTAVPPTQRQILDDLVAKGTDGIAVSVIDPDNQTDFLNKIAGADAC